MRKLTFPRSIILSNILEALHREREHELQIFLPSGAVLFADADAMVLLAQEARELGHVITIVTPDAIGQRHALAAGLRTLNERGEDVSGHAHGSSVEVWSSRSFQPSILARKLPAEPLKAKEPAAPQPRQEPTIEEDLLGISEPSLWMDQVRTKRSFRIPSLPLGGFLDIASKLFFLKKNIRLWTGIAVVIIGGIIASIALPRVDVTIKARTEDISVSFKIAVATKPSDDLSVIAGQVIEVTERVSKQYRATGEKEVTEKARGTIRVFNNFGASPQTLITSTRFISQDGKLFRSTETVVVPGAEVSADGKVVKEGSVDVDAIAAEAGEGYNTGPSTFSIPGFQGTPKFTAFYGKSFAPMRGGAAGVTKILTENDKKNAEEEVMRLTEEKLKASFAAKTPQGFVVLGDAQARAIVVKTDRNVGEAGEEFTVSGDGKMQAMLFREEDVITKLENELGGRLKQKAYLVPHSARLQYTADALSFTEQKMQLTIDTGAKVAWEIDIERVGQALSGKSEKDIRAFFAGEEAVSEARVSFWPFWVSSAPKDPSRITIKVTLE